MQIAVEVSRLLTWQWVTVIAIVVVHRPVGRFLDRVLEFRIGRKGLSARASEPNVPKPGEFAQRDSQKGEVRERVEAQHFVLRDAEGRKRAELGTSDTNSALLTLYDGNARPRVALYATENGASVLSFEDEHGQPRVMLASSDPGDAKDEDVLTGFLMRNREGNLAAGLIVDAGSNPALDLYSPSGESLFNAQ
jgi:hypothetical protein